MADTKKEAINNAKTAVLDSVGFILTGTKPQADSLRKSAIVAAKASVTVRKTITNMVVRFALYSKQIASIKSTLSKTKGDKAQLTRIKAIISSGGNAYKERQAELEEKPSAAASIKGIANASAGAGVAALGLAGLIGLLLNPEIRNIALGFFTSFLEGMGLSSTAIANLKTGLAVAIGIVGVYLATSVIQQVANAFTHMKRLAEVIGLAGQAIELKNAEIEIEKGKQSKLRQQRLKRVKSLKRVKRILSLASAAFKASLLAAAVGVAIDTVGGTLIDVMTKDEDQELDAAFIGKTIVNNLVESVSFGLLSGPFDTSKTPGSELDEGASITALPQGSPSVDVNVNKWHEPDAAPSSGPSSPAPAPASAPGSSLTPSERDVSDVVTKSVQVDQAKRDVTRDQGLLVVNNINNSSSLISISKPAMPPAAMAFSQSVGM